MRHERRPAPLYAALPILVIEAIKLGKLHNMMAIDKNQ